ncbi:DUF2339 domain-containing protein [Candidatus Woesearchaeota archaeon]|nr:DUF2339 domain-containing protein [Candidatus Woesearchaeota archaeon]
MPDPLTNLKHLTNIVIEQNKRINRLENEVKKLKGVQVFGQQNDEEPKKIEKARPKRHMNISPTMTITSVGIAGIIIGLISFFMYAISNRWIGPMAQISIGMAAGLVLFAAGYLLYNKHPKWAVTSFGGAVTIELISVGFGVWYYSIISEIAALALLMAFLAGGIFLSLKYDSLLVAYFSIGGGIITPIIAKVHTKPMVAAVYLVFLALGVLILSNNKKWNSLRMVSFLAIAGYEVYLFNSFHPAYRLGLSAEASIIFLTIFFLAYNLSSILFSTRQDQKISKGDVVLLNLNTFFSAALLTRIFFSGDEVITKTIFGIILLIASFFFLVEVRFLKSKFGKNRYLDPTVYSLISSGIILINVGLVLIFFRQNPINLIILALPQWFLFSWLSKITEDKKYYKVFSYIFLGAAVYWWVHYLAQFPRQFDKASFVMFMMLVFLAALFYSVKKGMGKALHGFLLIFLGFTFFHPLMQYIRLTTSISGEVSTTILSGLWLVYTLTLYIKTRENEKLRIPSVLSLVLLVITLAKIAFLDLTRLGGVVKIIGFIVFGVLLLIGGYLLKK